VGKLSSNTRHILVVRKQVLINPETKAHVLVEHKVENGTARNIFILIACAIVVANIDATSQRIDLDLTNERR